MSEMQVTCGGRQAMTAELKMKLIEQMKYGATESLSEDDLSALVRLVAAADAVDPVRQAARVLAEWVLGVPGTGANPKIEEAISVIRRGTV